MRHQVLGEITRENDDGDGVASIPYQNRMIKVRIVPDDVPYDQAVDLAAAVVSRIDCLDPLAKQVAASQLIDGYNGGWNEYDEVQEDGTVETVSNPQLTEAEFVAKLTLRAINVIGGAWIALFYDDENMFWGHSVVVNSMNGIEFTDTDAEIFG